MLIRLLAIVISVGSCLGAKAQVAKTFVIHTWEIPVAVIPPEEQVRYPDFRNGIIYSINGKTETVKLNYSMIYGEMQFIDSKGDTLALVNEQEVNKIIIDGDEFYSLYGRGYAEVVTSYRPLSLARQQFLKILWGERLSKTYGSRHQDDRYTRREVYYQRSKGLLKIGKQVSFLFIDHNQRFYPAQKSVLLDLYPHHRKQIQDYLKANKVDFKKQED